MAVSIKIPDWILKNKSKVKGVISKFRKKKILVVGDLMLDQFIWGKVSRISPEAPVPVVWVERESFMPGGACNVAHNIQDLSGQAILVGVIGEDSSGAILLEELRKKNLDVSGILRLKGRPTTHKTRVIAHSQQVVRIDREVVDPIPRSLANRLLEFIGEKISEVEAVIIEDYGKGVIIPYLVRNIVEFGKKFKKIVTVDPKKEHFRYYKNITVITPNKSETETAVGMEIKNDRDLIKAGGKLLKKLSARCVLITLGERGMCLFQKNKKPMHIPTMAKEVYDVSGAGDTVIASFTLSLASGADYPEAAYIANQAAGIVVGKIGTATVSREELIKEINRWK
jgi:D-beta-D-heptose 7-phosphate kinase/D-beta-D-heptose 1-phosphate adenosyltransferase